MINKEKTFFIPVSDTNWDYVIYFSRVLWCNEINYLLEEEIMASEERTFVAIKPDGVKRGLIGRVIERFEDKGFKIVGMKLLQVTPEMAAKHYEEHKGKSFYNRFIFII